MHLPPARLRQPELVPGVEGLDRGLPGDGQPAREELFTVAPPKPGRQPLFRAPLATTQKVWVLLPVPWWPRAFAAG